MQPFLLAFVDSQAFTLIGGAFVLVLGLAALAAGVLVLALLRNGLRRWQQLRSAAGSGTWWQHTGVGLQLLPAGVIILFGIGAGAMTLLQSRQDSRRETAYQAALEQQIAWASAEAAGRYVLADSILPVPNPNWYRDKEGWVLADTLLLTTDKLNRGRTPHIELTLRDNGTFTYRSNIVGDSTGLYATGRWKMQPEYMDNHRLETVRNLHNYKFVFYDASPHPGNHALLGGSLSAHNGHATITLVSGFWVRDNSLILPLKKSATAASRKAPG